MQITPNVPYPTTPLIPSMAIKARAAPKKKEKNSFKRG